MHSTAAKYVVAAIALAVVLVLANAHSYLLFHTMVEMFCVVVSISVFLLVWNAKDLMKNDFAFFLGLALLFTGSMDFFHVLVYEGMGIFPNYGANTATQIWIASRLVLSASFLISMLFLRRRLNPAVALAAFLAIGALIGQSIFYWKIFPNTFVPGGGLTAFKIAAEIASIAMFAGAIFVLHRAKDKFDANVRAYLCISLALNILASIFFTWYSGVYDWQNFAGHIAKLFAYFALYKALIEIALTKPYKLLFYRLEQNIQLKDDLLGMVSHDLKTPVSSIKLLADTLEHQLPEEGKARKAASLIGRQADEMGRLVNDFLEYGRIETGKIQLELSDFDLKELIESCIESLGGVAQGKKFMFEESEEAVVRADRRRISQVVTNILANAVKYSMNGGDILISLSTSDGWAHASVRDFGIGIQKENQSKIFDKYFRTPRGERRAEGVGMGLYIAKSFVEIHNGKIWVESEPEKGSTFHFTLPLARDAGAALSLGE